MPVLDIDTIVKLKQQQKPTMNEAECTFGHQTYRILIADDDLATRAFLKSALEREGYIVETAGDGRECFLKYKTFEPDIVVLDAMMPETDGLTCCLNIRAIDEKVTILIVTFVDEREFINRAFEVGATDYVSKPINWLVLRQRIKRILEITKLSQRAETLETQITLQQRRQKFLTGLLTQIDRPTITREGMNTILDKIRHFYDTERALIYPAHHPGKLEIMESKQSHHPSLSHLSLSELGLEQKYSPQYKLGEIIAVEDVKKVKLANATSKQMAKEGIKSFLLIPIGSGSNFLGVLGLFCDRERTFNQLEVSLASDIAHILPVFIDKLQYG